MNDENLINTVNEVFEEMEINDIIEEMTNHRSKINDYLITVTASMIVVRTLQKLVKKL